MFEIKKDCGTHKPLR